MLRIFLKAMNAPGLILMAAIGVAIQTSLFTWYPLFYFQPDIILVLVIWLGLSRTFTEGGVITLILANIAEVHSTAPQGLFLAIYLLVYFWVRVLNQLFVLQSLGSLIILTMSSSILWRILVVIFLGVLGEGFDQVTYSLLLIPPSILMSGFIGYWFYQFVDWYDFRTYKNTRGRMLEDQMLIGGEI